jgi:hypothetical protein
VQEYRAKWRRVNETKTVVSDDWTAVTASVLRQLAPSIRAAWRPIGK